MLDIDLIQFIESLPSNYRVRLMRKKIIHKHFAKKALPDRIINRRKKGFLSPTRKWFKKIDLLRDILLDPNSLFSSYFNLTEVDKVLTRHESGFNMERQIFLLLSIYYWMSEYLEKNSEHIHFLHSIEAK